MTVHFMGVFLFCFFVKPLTSLPTTKKRLPMLHGKNESSTSEVSTSLPVKENAVGSLESVVEDSKKPGFWRLEKDRKTPPFLV